MLKKVGMREFASEDIRQIMAGRGPRSHAHSNIKLIDILIYFIGKLHVYGPNKHSTGT